MTLKNSPNVPKWPDLVTLAPTNDESHCSQVFCLKDGAAAAPDDCDPDKMLLSEEGCNKDPCPDAEEGASGINLRNKSQGAFW